MPSPKTPFPVTFDGHLEPCRCVNCRHYPNGCGSWNWGHNNVAQANAERCCIYYEPRQKATPHTQKETGK